MEFMSVLKALEDSPKGRLKYETGWDEAPNAITNLIAVVQEKEVDKPNREIVERAFTSFYEKDRRSFSPKASPQSVRVSATRGRQSLPVSMVGTTSQPKGAKESSPISPQLLSSFLNLKVEESQRAQQRRPILTARKNIQIQSEPRIEVQEVLDEVRSPESGAVGPLDYSDGNYRRRLLLTPPSRILHRKKSCEGSPIFKPSPSFSSSTQTQTHSSATSDATSVTPTRNPVCNRKTRKYGIADDAIHEYENQLEEDIILESRVSPYNYIQNCLTKYEEEEEKKLKLINQERILRSQKALEECERKIAEAEAAARARREEEEALKQSWIRKQQTNLQELQSLQLSRQRQEDRLQLERKAAATAAEASRKAALEAAQQEQLRIQKASEDEERRRTEERLEKQRLLQQKADEEKRIAVEQAAAESKRKIEEQKKSQDVVPELAGLILKDDLSKYAKTTELLRSYEEPVGYIDGKDPTTKAFYIGAVKCINTPLNALADTNEGEIMAKVQHFSKLLSGEPVSGGGSMATMFSCASVPNGNLFVMKTLAFRFVKKAEADVTRGNSTIQPLATVGVHLCKNFPAWASLVQAYFYKLCPFLVPFSHPQGDKSILEYAKELGHDLSGTETAVQQTFLERIKGYCTLYALMILRFQNEGNLDVGDATSFFTIGGAWHILATTMRLEPQVDVTATVIHTLLDILDDRLHAIYRSQFIKLMRALILNYLPRIKNITPPAKSGSVSRLQIYLEKKFST